MIILLKYLLFTLFYSKTFFFPGKRHLATAKNLFFIDNPFIFTTLDRMDIEQKQADYLESEIQLILFNINDVEYAININNIVEIIKLLPANPLPGAPDFILGVVNLRGKVIPLIDLRERFSLKPNPFTKKTRIIIANIQNSEIGIIVDAVTDVIGIQADRIEPPLPVIEGLKIEFVEGIARFKKKLVIILNIEKVLSTKEKYLLKESLYDKFKV